METLPALSPFLGLAFNAAVQIAAFRGMSAGLLQSELLGFCAGLLPVLAVEGAARRWIVASGVPSDAAARALMPILTYLALGYCHFHFVNLGETARRIRLLRELHEAGGTLSHGELIARYGAREVVERRIARLLGTGQVVIRGDRYYTGSRLLVAVARGMAALKRFLLRKESEHDE